MTPHIVDVRETHRRWARMLVVRIQMPSGELVERDVEDHGEAVAVLPYDPLRRVALLVRQCRAAPLLAVGETDTLEVPAGRLENEAPEACARREVMEEVGLRLGELQPVAITWTMAALSTERAHLYLAPYSAADRVAAGGGLADEQEVINVAETSLVDLASLAGRGRIADIKLLLLVQTLRLRRPELFIV